MSTQERIYSINNSTFTIRFGNILDTSAEVIVSSDDNYLSMGGGVSGSIRIGAGETIRRDTQKLVPAEIGDVVVSTAGDLQQKYVFHCITLLKNRGKRIRPKDIKTQQLIIWRCFEKCFRLMPLLDIHSIAFPPIGSRVARYSLDDIAKSIAAQVSAFCYNTNKQYNIELWIPYNMLDFDMMDYVVFFEEITKCISNYEKKEDSIIITQSDRCNDVHESYSAKHTRPGEKHKTVFISYSRLNKNQASLFCDVLDQMGITYWIDIEGYYSGSNFKEEIVDAIEACKMVVFLSSQESNQSRNVIKEVGLAVGMNKPILPIKLDDSQYAKSLRFDLSDIDWIDFDELRKDEMMDKFMNCITLSLDRYENVNQ